MKKYKVLGVKVNIIEKHLLKKTLIEFIDSNKQHQITTVNPEFIINSHTNKEFKDIINNSSLATIDGSGIIWSLRFKKYKVSLDDRITGVDLTKILINLARHNNYKILFCLHNNGLTSPDNFFIKIKDTYQNLDFQVSDQDTALEKAQSFKPEIILVGFGAPLQDIWINDNLKNIPHTKIAMGVGGTFDFLSKAITRAPKVLQSIGLEWLWRLIQQPQLKRVRRILRAIIVFPYLIIKDRIKTYENKN